MRLITFPITKEKINKKTLTIVITVVLFFLVVNSYIWLQKAGRLPEISLDGYLRQLTAGLIGMIEKEELLEEKVTPEELEVVLPAAPKVASKVYEEIAEAGEGITHLARKALQKYLSEKGQDLNLSPEHKIYIEDYIQKKTGDGWLMLGETLTFSEELIVEAINKAQQLTPDQLENLKQYSQLVSFF
ncbi:MAG: hypothetical protein QME57_00570 [Patescibacteria group bacterium]|nr:hypothetical protein [Patescibacteria group bacterium]